MKTEAYRTLREFIAACQKNGIRIVRIATHNWVEPSKTGIRGVTQVKLTACSVKSPVLRTWVTTRKSKETVIGILEVEDFGVSDGEWTKDVLQLLLP